MSLYDAYSTGWADKPPAAGEVVLLLGVVAVAGGLLVTAALVAGLSWAGPAAMTGEPEQLPDSRPESPETAGDQAAESDITEQNPADTGALVVDSEDSGATPEPEEPAPDRSSAMARLEAAHAATRAGVRREYDWEAMRRRYVEGVKNPDGETYEWPSMDAVAAHFGVPGSRVRTVGGQQGWRAARMQWQAQVEATRRQAKAAALSKEATQLDTSALNAAKLGLQLAQFQLTRIGQQRDVAPPDAQEMQRWAQAIDLFHKIGLRAVGDPETHRLEITGANGAPIEIAAELRRDDPGRLVGVLGVLAQAGLGELFGTADQAVLEGELADDELGARR